MQESVRRITLVAFLLTTACSGRSADDGADPATRAEASADSLAAAERIAADRMRSDSRATLSELLSDPASATFDSLIVVRPPPVDGRTPPMAACGRISGRPGIGGSRSPTRFVYQGRFTVFVEESGNREEFASLWSRVCDVAGATIYQE